MFPPWPRRSRETADAPDADAGEGHADPGSHRELGLLSLLELSNELSTRVDVFEIGEVALFNLMGHFGCSRSALWLFPGESAHDAVLLRAHGVPEPVARGVGALWARWMRSLPSLVSEPVLVDELRGVGSVPGLDLAVQGGISLLAPVSMRTKPLGFLALGRRVNGADFGTFDREFLHAALNLLGAAFENTTLQNRTIESNRRLRLANRKLQDVDRMKSEFLSSMNHELRTPLTIIIAYLETLIAGEREEGTRLEHLRVARDQAAHLHSMVLNILDFTELSEDVLEMRPARGDVRAVLATYWEDRRPGVTAELREFLFSSSTEVPPAVFDRDRLVQIVDALVENAVKFTPRGSRILLRVEGERTAEGERVRIDVEDSGPGIPPDRASSIFEPFRQGDNSNTRAKGGLGLGLAMAKRLADKMGGELAVATGIGEGTVFTLRLPAG